MPPSEHEPPLRLNATLLDIVPWSFGFAHSFALRWLLEQPSVGPRILAAAEGFPLAADGAISDVRAERSGGRGRADIVFWLTDRDGARHEVFVETKVNDHLTAEQMQAYGANALLYVPGLTGLFTETGALRVEGARLTGGALASALEAVRCTLPPLIQGYVDAVEAEHHRMQEARRVARAEAPADSVPNAARYDAPSAATVCDVAWLAEIAGYLAHRDGTDDKIVVRIDRHNRAIKWDIGGRFRHDRPSWIWIDLVATHRNRRELRIRCNGPLREDIRALGRTMERLPSDANWSRPSRATHGKTVSVLSLDLTTGVASEGVEAATAAADWIDELKRTP